MKKNRVKDKFLNCLRQMPIIQVACEKCNLSRQTVHRWIKEDYSFKEEMEEALNEGDELCNDITESKHLALINERYWPAIKYHLDKKHPKYKIQPKDEHGGKMSLLELSERLYNEEERKKLGEKNKKPEEYYDDDE